MLVHNVDHLGDVVFDFATILPAHGLDHREHCVLEHLPLVKAPAYQSCGFLDTLGPLL